MQISAEACRTQRTLKEGLTLGLLGAAADHRRSCRKEYAQVLNYGQSIFEGMKAQRSARGRIVLFRPEENAARMRAGAAHCRVCPDMGSGLFVPP